MTDTPEDTRAVYEQEASTYDKQRSRALFEARWLARFTAALPAQGHILDVGCGTGEPIARWFLAEGFAVTGVDFAEAMLDFARRRWPDGDWRQADMRDMDLGQRFDGIICWNSFFHLTMDEQRAFFPRLSAHLKPGGSAMLTVGPRAGDVTGQVNGRTVFHSSLSPAEYTALLQENGLRLTGFLAEDADTSGHTVLMARKDWDG